MYLSLEVVVGEETYMYVLDSSLLRHTYVHTCLHVQTCTHTHSSSMHTRVHGWTTYIRTNKTHSLVFSSSVSLFILVPLCLSLSYLCLWLSLCLTLTLSLVVFRSVHLFGVKVEGTTTDGSVC